MHELFVHPHRCLQCGVDRLIPARPIDGLALEKLVQKNLDFRFPFRAQLTKPRNPLVHRFYFAAIAAAARRWPENEEPFPNGDEKLLRAWLQTKAGYFKRIDFDLGAKEGLMTLLAMVRDENKYCFVKEATKIAEDGEIVPILAAYIPLSIRYEELDDEAFSPIKTPVFERIETMFGMDVKTLVKLDETAEA